MVLAGSVTGPDWIGLTKTLLLDTVIMSVSLELVGCLKAFLIARLKGNLITSRPPAKRQERALGPVPPSYPTELSRDEVRDLWGDDDAVEILATISSFRTKPPDGSSVEN